ncbi:MAG TPA: kelch repeat-containing protein [Methylomirabilota bacterium]|nr:kelch repeat-containing protein [Methylomirabilota bacterium]
MGLFADPIAYHAAAWLTDGRLLLIGGTTGSGTADQIRVIDRTGRMAVSTLAAARTAATATLLADGSVAVAGGVDVRGPFDTVEILNPATGASAVASVRLPRAVSEHTATLLPNGRLLITGGRDARGQSRATVQWLDLTTAHASDLVDLAVARAGHTASLLTDGRVLVAGGQGPAGVTGSAEIWDLASLTSTTLPAALRQPRMGHTATLLPSGEVLISGGVGADGRALATIERFDPVTGIFRASSVSLLSPRAHHTATLLPTGEVLLWGGVDRSGAILAAGEIFDPRRETLRAVSQPLGALAADQAAPALFASLPGDGASDVPTTASIALRFSEPLRMTSVTTGTVTMTGPAKDVAIAVVPADAGLLVFVTPVQPLQTGTTYALRLDGLGDTAGWPVPSTRLTFTTAAAPGTAVGGGGGSPGEMALGPPISSAPAEGDRGPLGDEPGAPASGGQSLPPLEAPPGVTAVAGQALELDGTPLAHVTLEIGHKKAKTDQTGRFILVAVPPGHGRMLIDGRSASRAGRTYGVFQAGLEVTAGRTNVLPFTIWMPEIDTAHAVTIPSPTTAETVITSPAIPGLEVRIPAGSVIFDHEHHVATHLSLTQIPLDRPPFPLPKHVDVPLYFTLQPGAGYVSNATWTGARIIYPNRRQAPPGTRFDFWHYDPDGKGWFVYGQGEVTRDGRQIVPDPGVAVYEFTGAMVALPSLAPPTGPVVAGAKRADPVDVATGLFVLEKTDLALPDTLPLVLTRTYRQNDTRSRAFGIGASHPYDIFLVGDVNPYTYVDIILPDGGRVHFTRISPGTGPVDAVYQHTATPTAFYGAKIAWNPGPFVWELTLKDGTVWWFPEAALQTIAAKAAVKQIRDRFGNTIQFARDGTSGDLLTLTSPTGRWINFTYDTSHRITAAADNLGRQVQYQYDASGRLTQVTDPNGGVTQYTYDADHRMLTLRDARGITYLTNAYDATGRVITQTQADNTTFQFAYTVDVNNTITQTDVTDPRAIVERVTFNSPGYMLTDTRALGRPEQQVTTYARQAGTNLVQSVTDALNRQTTFTYDTMGNVTSVTRLASTPQAVMTSFTWEAPSATTFNRLTSVTPPLGPTTTRTFAYDDVNHRVTVTDPLGHATVLTQNAAGQVVSVANALQQATTFEYDLPGNLTAIVDPLGNRATRAYDAVGRLTQQTDPRGTTTAYVYDLLNQLRALGDPLGTTRFTYDANGNLLSVTDARGSGTSYAYNNMDRLQSRTDPLLRSESYTYDNHGNLATFTDRKSQITSRTYDGLNRPALVTYADTSTTAYTWDAGDRLTQITDSLSGTITRSYDLLDRRTQETTPQGTISYSYDAAGRRTSMTAAGQPTVTYAYDNADRLTSITQGASLVTFGYDNADRRTSLTLPNGVTTTYAYNAASQLTGLTYALGATTLGTLIYGYDTNGNRRAVGGTWARTGLPQPVASATYNAANQQLTFGAQTLTYDLNGNLTSDGTNTYAWNVRNKLATITGLVPASFVYDGTGRRRAKTISDSTTNFLYDGINPIQEQAGASVRNLLTGLGVDEYLTRDDGAGLRLFLADALGSTIALVDNAAAVQGEYTYEPFGATTATGTLGANTLTYTGREDDETGLKYYRARYYHPAFQRFISEDPIGLLAGDPNFYIYVGNNPVSFVDPTGLDKERPSCFSRNRFASLFAGTGWEPVVTVVEIVSLSSLATDLVATGVKATRVGVGGPKQPYASGLNALSRGLGRAVGRPALTGALVAVGDIATPILAVTATFTGAYDATILAQCALGVIE